MSKQAHILVLYAPMPLLALLAAIAHTTPGLVRSQCLAASTPVQTPPTVGSCRITQRALGTWTLHRRRLTIAVVPHLRRVRDFTVYE